MFFLPPPTAIAYAIYEYWPAIYRNSLITLWATLVGFGLAVGFGLLLGLVDRLVALDLCRASTR